MHRFKTEICFSHIVPIQPLLESFEHNLGQNSSIKRLFQSTLGPISVVVSLSAPGNWTVLALIYKGAKLNSNVEL